jgi:vacuolar-type H+-ATPase subunit H
MTQPEAARDVSSRIEDLIAVVEGARAVPLSASCVIHRGDVLETLDALRLDLPLELRDAREVLAARDAIVADGRLAAEQLIVHAREEAARLVEETEIVVMANERANHFLAEATEEATAIKTEAETYVDGRLATLEVILTKTMDAVARGRARLAGEKESDVLTDQASE